MHIAYKKGMHLRILEGAVLLLAILLAFSVSTVFAQENAGSIQGVVKDSTGAIIRGANVTADSRELVRPLNVVTDDAGFYNFPRLPIGTFTVTATMKGFKTVKKENISVQLGSMLKLDMELPVGDITSEVTVNAATEAIDITSSKTSTNITERFIETVPKGRTFNSILQSAPGVVFDPRAGSVGGGVTGTVGNNPGGGVGGYSVNGASGSENQFVIDGVEVSNVRNAALGRESAIPFEFVREVQVKSGGFEAEYGGATGGVINVITKSGSDQFHGEGTLMFTNAGLNSAPRGFWQRVPGNSAAAEFFRQKEDKYRTLYPGFSLGGPIIKERLHFFASYFPEIGYTERSTDFTAAGSGPKTATNRLLRHYALGRLDYAPTQKIQFNTSYIWTPIRNTGLVYGTDGRIAPPSNDLSIGGGYTPANAYTASFTYTATSKLILSARYGYKYLNDRGNTYGLPTAAQLVYQTPTSQQTSPPVPADLAGAAGKSNISSPFQVLKDITTRHNVYLDGSYIARLFGQQHIIKAGYALNRIANDVHDDYPNGLFLITWGEGYTRGSIINARGTYGYYIWRDGIKHNAQASSRNEGFYFQDMWQVHRRVTINAGVRFENEFLPPFTKVVNGVPIPNPISFGWGDKIAPRLGGAWDVLGNGNWKLSASFGMFYDTMKYELARSSFGGDYWHDHVYKMDSPNISSLSSANPGALGAQLIDIDNRTIPINAQGQLDGIDPGIKPMLSREFSVASEHRMGSWFFSGRYTRKRLVRGIEDIGVLDAQENEVYTIGNPGFSQTDASKFTAPNGQPLTPKAVRNYDGLEFRVNKRFNNFFMHASYTYSRLFGNWAGLANSDEAGRSQPNVSRAFDLTQGNFDQKGKNVYGLLATDRPHAFKFYGNYDLKWPGGVTNFSYSQIVYSGTPLSSEVLFIVPVFFNGRGDLGRTPVFSQADALVTHTVQLSEKVKVKFDANITNLFNQAAVIGKTTRINRSGNLPITVPVFFAGFDTLSYIKPANSSTPPAANPIYKLPNSYQGIREIRVGVHFVF